MPKKDDYLEGTVYSLAGVWPTELTADEVDAFLKTCEHKHSMGQKSALQEVTIDA